MPERIRGATPVPVRIAMKLMNARFDDAFQLAMMDAAANADALVCFNHMILEYTRRGCESVQLHTFFQLPLSEYPATHSSRPQRTLHVLVFHPRDGLVAGMLELEAQGKLERRNGEKHFLDLANDTHRPD